METQPSKFSDKVVWISGAAQGIGRGIAKYFACNGAKVALVDRNLEVGQSLAEEINKEGGTAKFIASDLSEDMSIRQSIEQTVALWGSLHIVINNAAVIIVKPLHQYSSEEWDAQMAINLRAYFLSFKYAYPHLKQHTTSYVVNLGSVNSFVGQAHTPGYNTSKGAIINLTKSIAIDYAVDGIRCNMVCPGITDTPMLRSHMIDEETLSNRLYRVPLQRILQPAEIAKAVAFLCSEESSGITGTHLIIDGGYLATAEWGNNH